MKLGEFPSINRIKSESFMTNNITILIIFTLIVVLTYSSNNLVYASITTTPNNSTDLNRAVLSSNIINKSSDIHSTVLSNNIILVKPSSLEKEHKEIHEKLASIVSSTGQTANVAKEVQSIMQPHFEEEEKLSISVLGALQPYVNGTLTQDAKDQAIKLSQQFKQKYPTMLEEHKQIVVALDRLQNTATKENRQDVISFIEQLRNHALSEEQITYPATIVIGELLELKK